VTATSDVGGKHYTRTPIIEAVIEFKIEPREGLTLAELARVWDGEEARYPDSRRHNEHEIELRDATSKADGRHVGHIFVSEDGRQSFHSRIDGFLLSRSAPYDCWDSICSEALRLWGRYRKVVEPRSVTRIGLRYINRIDVPEPSVDLKDYLRTSPEISSDLPQVLSGYFMQLVLPLPDFDCAVTINSALVAPVEPNVTSIILDLDVIRKCLLVPVDPNFDSQLREILALLRKAKNQVFEACITAKTRELIV
jgi:uncharacterized protein (TIGR04255 family)